MLSSVPDSIHNGVTVNGRMTTRAPAHTHARSAAQLDAGVSAMKGTVCRRSDGEEWMKLTTEAVPAAAAIEASRVSRNDEHGLPDVEDERGNAAAAAVENSVRSAAR